jgi:hypothetical protein
MIAKEWREMSDEAKEVRFGHFIFIGYHDWVWTDRTSLQPYKKQHEQNKAIFEMQKDTYNELTGYGQVEEVQFDGRFRLVRG